MNNINHYYNIIHPFLFNIINAAKTPGIQPAMVSKNTINTLPQPLSITAKGGKNIDKMTRNKLINI
jgi:hypothetical protein